MWLASPALPGGGFIFGSAGSRRGQRPRDQRSPGQPVADRPAAPGRRARSDLSVVAQAVAAWRAGDLPRITELNLGADHPRNQRTAPANPATRALAAGVAAPVAHRHHDRPKTHLRPHQPPQPSPTQTAPKARRSRTARQRRRSPGRHHPTGPPWPLPATCRPPGRWRLRWPPLDGCVRAECVLACAFGWARSNSAGRHQGRAAGPDRRPATAILARRLRLFPAPQWTAPSPCRPPAPGLQPHAGHPVGAAQSTYSRLFRS